MYHEKLSLPERPESDARLGAVPLPNDRCWFRVWAPRCAEVEVHLVDSPGGERYVRMRRDGRGYHQALIDGVPDGALYLYRLNGEKERPDPASRAQPRGVHGPSQVVGRSHVFSPAEAEWRGLPLEQLILYELHVGTFSRAGTFAGVVAGLDALGELGVTAIELLPVAQFPGRRNWGYDGVYPFAVQDSYGGRLELARLVDACHQRGLAVILDVVYNHLGPEGNYLADFGPYFTDRYRTAWGGAVNLDGPGSDEVRHYFLENARSFVRELHVDGLRLDATHALFDTSARPFLQELADAIHTEAAQLGRRVHLIAEDDRNDPRLVTAPELGGHGLDAQWSDDLHHALHARLTGERSGYYQDFGELSQLVKALREGFVYTGEYSPARQRRHGASARGLAGRQLVVCAQNHDQVGNRMRGERLSQLVPESALQLAAATVLLGPFVPLLFMGEEYGETAPFQYFTSHGDRELVEAVRRGRREEFAAFAWQGEVPDPQDEATFERSRLDSELRCSGAHARLFAYYKELIRLRREVPALGCVSKSDTEVAELAGEVLRLTRVHGEATTCVLLHFGVTAVDIGAALPSGSWVRLLDTSGTLPARIDTAERAALRLPAGAVAVFSKAPTRPTAGAAAAEDGSRR